mmetsp:Transcript_8486/g.21696  ORF Transcript_8486/g.21696 Transcript_8486/m.21696 type:complete len:288 (+) Transcript_8486:172-1035(+)
MWTLTFRTLGLRRLKMQWLQQLRTRLVRPRRQPLLPVTRLARPCTRVPQCPIFQCPKWQQQRTLGLRTLGLLAPCPCARSGARPCYAGVGVVPAKLPPVECDSAARGALRCVREWSVNFHPPHDRGMSLPPGGGCARSRRRKLWRRLANESLRPPHQRDAPKRWRRRLGQVWPRGAWRAQRFAYTRSSPLQCSRSRTTTLPDSPGLPTTIPNLPDFESCRVYAHARAQAVHPRDRAPRWQNERPPAKHAPARGRAPASRVESPRAVPATDSPAPPKPMGYLPNPPER